jgi:Putative Mg2+ and Co2+ transporter CorC
MNEGRSPENQESRSWFDRLASVLSGEAENKSELVSELRDANARGLFNQETLAIMEGALVVSDMQVREVMIPRTR